MPLVFIWYSLAFSAESLCSSFLSCTKSAVITMISWISLFVISSSPIRWHLPSSQDSLNVAIVSLFASLTSSECPFQWYLALSCVVNAVVPFNLGSLWCAWRSGIRSLGSTKCRSVRPSASRQGSPVAMTGPSFPPRWMISLPPSSTSQ